MSKPSRWEEIGKDKVIKYLFFLPISVLIALVIVYPICYSAWLSFYDVSIMNYFNAPFNGIKNYVEAVSSYFFWNSIRVTATFVVFAVILELVIGFTLAFLVSRNVKGTDFFLYILIIPLALSPVVVGLIFRMGLNALYGTISYYLSLVGLPRSPLSNASSALWTIIIIDVWQWSAFVFIVVYAGFRALPREPFEAAHLDGASSWHALIHIALPMLKPVLAVSILFRIMDAFKTFDLVYILTGGGPGQSTETIAMYIQRVTLTQGKIGIGLATTLLVALFVIVFARSYIWLFLSQNKG